MDTRPVDPMAAASAQGAAPLNPGANAPQLAAALRLHRWFWPALAGGLLFTVLFLHEYAGLNVLLWSPVLLGLSLLRRPLRTWPAAMRAVAAGMLLAALNLAWHGSALAFLCWLFLVLLWVGMVQAPQLRLLPLWGLASAQAHLTQPLRALESLTLALLQPGGDGRRKVLLLRSLAALLTLPVLLVFYLLYRDSSEAFAQATDWAFRGLAALYDLTLAHLDFAMFWMAVLSSLWLVCLLHPMPTPLLQRWQRAYRPHLEVPTEGNIPLLHQLLRSDFGTVLLVGVNLLLLGLNLADIRTYWFNPEAVATGGGALAAKLHAGTGTLIVSILLAMGVLLTLFQAKLYYVPHQGRLRLLAYAWLAQNALLVVNVMVRDGYYVAYQGLAYKRLLLLAFLALTLWGLLTLAQKIGRGHSLAWLLQRNLAAAIGLWVLTTFVNWDQYIARYNLRHQAPEATDYGFLLDMQRSVLPLLVPERPHMTPAQQQRLDARIREAHRTFAGTSFLSRSWDGQQAYRQLPPPAEPAGGR